MNRNGICAVSVARALMTPSISRGMCAHIQVCEHKRFCWSNYCQTDEVDKTGIKFIYLGVKLCDKTLTKHRDSYIYICPSSVMSQVFVHINVIHVRKPLPSAALWNPTWRRSMVWYSSMPTRNGAPSSMSARNVATLHPPRIHCCAISIINIQTVPSCGPRGHVDIQGQQVLLHERKTPCLALLYLWTVMTQQDQEEGRKSWDWLRHKIILSSYTHLSYYAN